MVQCKETFDIKVNFILDIKQKLMKAKYKLIPEEVIDQMIRDIRRYLVSRDGFETN